jgi:hypothetical protein
LSSSADLSTIVKLPTSLTAEAIKALNNRHNLRAQTTQFVGELLQWLNGL